MDSIDDLHEFFDKRDVDQRKLKKLALYVESYTENLYKSYDVDITDGDLEFICIKLYKTLLHQVRNMSTQIENQDAKSIVDDLLEDFESEDNDKGVGNMIALVGKAGTIEELRHPKITELGRAIAAEQQENF